MAGAVVLRDAQCFVQWVYAWASCTPGICARRDATFGARRVWHHVLAERIFCGGDVYATAYSPISQVSLACLSKVGSALHSAMKFRTVSVCHAAQ